MIRKTRSARESYGDKHQLEDGEQHGEDDYLPDGPPMSPLTRSYFTSWAFFDHRIGKTTDTLASCLIDANDIIWMNPDQLEALKKDWIDFLRRNMVGIKASSEAESFHWLLKFGPG